MGTESAARSGGKAALPQSLTALCPPADSFHLDQFKNGIFVDKQPVTQNRLVFGRAPDCDVVLEHPSISRYHAVLLWSPKNDDDFQKGTNTESFWYLIDCGSTHGTVCNKAKVDTGKMIKLIPNNNVIRFGASTRFFILGSPLGEDDEEKEDDAVFGNSQSNTKNDEQKEVDGVTWGMQFDDCNEEEEETGDSVALKSIISAMKGGEGVESANKSTYSDNPYKCIQQWYEREGYEFDYKVEQVNNNKFKCNFELPIDGQWITVEGSPGNRKKDAIHDACLKCCSILDQAQLLFPWQKQKKAAKAKEFYDDDDDSELIDETVKTNKKHKRSHDAGGGSGIDNYETLNAKWKSINDELCTLKVRLATIGLEPGVKPQVSDDLTDSLDAYLAEMNKKKFGLSLNEKIEKSNLRMKIKQLEQEQSKLEKLIKIAKPLEVKITPAANPVKATSVKFGIKGKDLIAADNSKPNEVTVEKSTARNILVEPEKIHEPILVDAQQPPQHNKTKDSTEMPPPSAKSKVSAKAIRKLKQSSIIEAIEKEKKLEKQKLNMAGAESDSDYVGWLPPANQAGDGRTHLNDKFGY